MEAAKNPAMQLYALDSAAALCRDGGALTAYE
jgi:hypothetical protein